MLKIGKPLQLLTIKVLIFLSVSKSEKTKTRQKEIA